MNDQFYRELIFEAPMGYALHRIICDSDGIPCDYVIVEMNEAFETLTGLHGEDIIDKRITEMLPDIKKEEFDWIRVYGDIALCGGNKDFEQFFEPLGQWYKISVYSPEKFYFVTLFTNISQLKTAKNALIDNERRLLSAQQIAHVGSWELNLETKKIWASEEAFSIYGIVHKTAYLSLKQVQSRVNRAYRKLLDEALVNLITKGEKYDIEFEINHGITGQQRFIHSIAVLQKDEHGKILKITGTIQDITEQKQRQEELAFLGYHDQLTGLYNRRFFEEEKRRLETDRQLPLSVIIADVDGLKLINDGFGYASGDKLLIEAANIIKACCRAEDIISRIGGDEFCILLPKTTAEAAKNIGKRIRNLCEATPIDIGDRTIKMSISMGLDSKSTSKISLSEVIKNAENSMRRKKLLERKSVRSDLMTSIKATMLEKSHETAEHAERLVNLSRAIGLELNLGDDKLFDLELATTLHDIGKMGIDQQTLLKEGELTSEEWIEIKKHPEAGYRIAQATSELMPISDYILSHHERWDGKGYPQGLKQEEIPLLARIINIVDSFDAMTHDRPYRRAMTIDEAEAEITRNAGTQFDPKIADLFVTKVLHKVLEK